MKKTIFLLTMGMIFWSCEEDFNPYGEFKEKFILNCVLRGDSTFQLASLTKSYNPSTFNPNVVSEDASIYGADVRVRIGDSVYIFSDSIVNRADTTRYKTPFHFYFHDYIDLPANKDLELEVLLPSGQRLTSLTKTPQKVQFDQRSEDVISEDSPNFLQFFWNISFTGQYFAPRLIFKYSKTNNGSTQVMIKEVPISDLFEGGLAEHTISVQSTLNVEMQSIRKALEEISAGDPNKANYTIYESALVQVLAFDQNLSRYYSTTNGSLDDLTVRIDEKDYSNINGGYGIFASYIKGEYKIKFLSSFIQSFGYKILISN
ncbi:MAG: DUF4249 family protein [Ignavibacteriaceae bacterium]|nr:DUF4249 family protein [Ignavibacteriaceae bacterium]